MKPQLIVTLLFFIVSSGYKHADEMKSIHASDGLWTGTIVFRQIVYDTVHRTHYCGWGDDTLWSEWHMEAHIIKNNGEGKSSVNGYLHTRGYDSCVISWGASRDTTFAIGKMPTALDLGIDPVSGEYGFTVDIPLCVGKTISKRYKDGVLTDTIIDDFTETDSQILVQGQKPGSNKNVLTGKIELHDRKDKGRDFVQIWEWKLTKS